MENIIGTVLLSANVKRNYTVYHIIFTDSRVLAIEADVSGKTGQGMMGQQQNPFSNNQALGFLAAAAMGGMMGGGNRMMNQPNYARMQGQQRWQSIKAASSGKPIISYDQKTVTDQMLSLGNISVPYQNIREVQVKKGLAAGGDFVIHFVEGLLAGEQFEIQGDAANNVVELIKKTPLASKLKT